MLLSGGIRLKPIRTGRQFMAVGLAVQFMSVFRVFMCGNLMFVVLTVLVQAPSVVSRFAVMVLTHFLALATRLVRCMLALGMVKALLSMRGVLIKAPWRTILQWKNLVPLRFGITRKMCPRLLKARPARKFIRPQVAPLPPLVCSRTVV